MKETFSNKRRISLGRKVRRSNALYTLSSSSLLRMKTPKDKEAKGQRDQKTKRPKDKEAKRQREQKTKRPKDKRDQKTE